MNPFNVSRKKRILKGISWLLLFVLLSTNGTLTSNVSAVYASEVSVSNNEVKVQEETDSAIGGEVSGEEILDEEKIDSEDLGPEEKNKTEGTSDKNSSKVEEGTDSSIEDEMLGEGTDSDTEDEILGEEVSDIIEDDIMDEVDDELLMGSFDILGGGMITPFGVVTDQLIGLNATLSQGGSELEDTDIIDSEEDLEIEISFRVPVLGDPEEDVEDKTPVEHGDTAQFEVSEGFILVSGDSMEVKFGEVVVGHLTFDSTSESGKVIANVVFDGDPDTFTNPTVNSVFCNIYTTLRYDNSGGAGSSGNHDVKILGKDYVVNVPVPPVVYTFEKTAGEPDLSARTVDWEVKVQATQEGSPVDLDGYKFIDNFSNGSKYVDNSLEINTSPVPPDGDSTDTNIIYTFPSGSTNEQIIKYKTSIPDSQYYGSGDQNISNTASLFDTVNNSTVVSDSDTTDFTPPKWIDKEGKRIDGGTPSSYEGRSIEWTITANPDSIDLKDVVITDVLGDEYENLKDIELLIDKDDGLGFVSSGRTITYDDISKEFVIGDIDKPFQLIFITDIVDDDNVLEERTYNNTASISWDGSPTGNIPDGLSASGGVDIGYNAFDKTGTVNTTNRTVDWEIKVKADGQASLANLQVYDLLVYGDVGSFDIDAVTWPSGYEQVKVSNINYNQKYVENSYTGDIDASDFHLVRISDGSKDVADLLVFDNIDNTKEYKLRFQSLILNPRIFANNSTGSSYRNISNTAELFTDNSGSWNSVDSANATPDYNSRVLGKEMLSTSNSDISIDPITGVNTRTTHMDEGFDYIDKSVIYRLSINADGIDWSDIEDGDGQKLGEVTVSDILPAGWEFDQFDDGSDYLIFSGIKSGNSIQANTRLDGSSILSAVNVEIGGSTAEFTFDSLDAPYVILVKARPDEDTLEGYFSDNKYDDSDKSRVTNEVSLKTEQGDTDVNVTREVAIKSQVLTKGNDITEDGILKWTINYQPYNMDINPENMELKIEDTLSQGMELRTNARGELLLSGNIAVHEMKLNTDGTYVESVEVPLILGEDISYDNESRTLTFMIPEKEKSYRLTYLTDLTGERNLQVENEVKLIGGNYNVIPQLSNFRIRNLDAIATMQRGGFLEIEKGDGVGGYLAGAEFTLFSASDGTTVIRKGETDANGYIALKAIPEGDYILRETKAPVGYNLEGISHTVKVVVVGASVELYLDGALVASGDKINIQNYLSSNVGDLTLTKNVIGNAYTGEAFEFIVELRNGASYLADSYSYIIKDKDNKDISNGKIVNGRATISLVNGDKIVIPNLPKGVEYTITEEDYSLDGYVTVNNKDNGRVATGIIVEETNEDVIFTNTKYKPGDLIISKVLSGNTKENKLFDFTISLSDKTNTYNYVGNNGAPSGTITGEAIIPLAGGQSIVISDIPFETDYKVQETDYSSDGYTTEYSDDNGGVKSSPLIIEGEMPSDKGVLVHYTNTKRVGSLAIEKAVSGNGSDKNKEFEFTVTFDNDKKYSYIGNGIPNGEIESGDTITLTDGQSIVIHEILVGTKYTVTENDYSSEGYVSTVSGNEGIIRLGDSNIAAFTNTRNLGTLSISKTVEGNRGDKNKEFEFTVTFNKDDVYSYTGNG